MIPLLLSAAAVIAYFLGCIDAAALSCGRLLGRSLRSFGGGRRRLESIYREYGVKGLAAVYLPEIIKTAAAVIIGGLLLSIKGHAEVGRMLALFCLLMGTAFPATARLRGGSCVLALCVGALCAGPKAGLFVVIVFAAVLALSRYLSLACVCAAAAGILGAWVFMDEKISIELSVFCALAVIFRHIGHIVRIIEHKEPKISTQKDLSYKFDEDF